MSRGRNTRSRGVTGAGSIFPFHHSDNPAVIGGVAVSPATGPLGGLSATIQVRPLPDSSGRTVTVGWYKPPGETIANLRNLGTAVWNAGTSRYELLWTFPGCAELPAPGNVTVIAQATGWDGVTVLGGSSYSLNGRGC